MVKNGWWSPKLGLIHNKFHCIIIIINIIIIIIIIIISQSELRLQRVKTLLD